MSRNVSRLKWSPLLVWLMALSARAEERESLERAAQKACLTGAPAKGVEILTDLYLDTRDATHIYNQGRCYEMNRQYEDAIGRFREYMVKAKGLRDEERAEVEKHIAACQSYLDEAKPEVEPPVPTADAVKPPGGGAAPMLQQSTETTAPRQGAGLRVAGLVVGAVGIAGLVTGVVLNVKVNSMSSDLEKPFNYSPETDATRKDYKTAGWVSYGVGATCLAGGALLYYLGRRAGTRASIQPTLGPDVAGAAIMGAF